MRIKRKPSQLFADSNYDSMLNREKTGSKPCQDTFKNVKKLKSSQKNLPLPTAANQTMSRSSCNTEDDDALLEFLKRKNLEEETCGSSANDLKTPLSEMFTLDISTVTEDDTQIKSKKPRRSKIKSITSSDSNNEIQHSIKERNENEIIGSGGGADMSCQLMKPILDKDNIVQNGTSSTNESLMSGMATKMLVNFILNQIDNSRQDRSDNESDGSCVIKLIETNKQKEGKKKTKKQNNKNLKRKLNCDHNEDSNQLLITDPSDDSLDEEASNEIIEVEENPVDEKIKQKVQKKLNIDVTDKYNFVKQTTRTKLRPKITSSKILKHKLKFVRKYKLKNSYLKKKDKLIADKHNISENHFLVFDKAVKRFDKHFNWKHITVNRSYFNWDNYKIKIKRNIHSLNGDLKNVRSTFSFENETEFLLYNLFHEKIKSTFDRKLQNRLTLWIKLLKSNLMDSKNDYSKEEFQLIDEMLNLNYLNCDKKNFGKISGIHSNDVKQWIVISKLLERTSESEDCQGTIQPLQKNEQGEEVLQQMQESKHYEGILQQAQEGEYCEEILQQAQEGEHFERILQKVEECKRHREKILESEHCKEILHQAEHFERILQNLESKQRERILKRVQESELCKRIAKEVRKNEHCEVTVPQTQKSENFERILQKVQESEQCEEILQRLLKKYIKILKKVQESEKHEEISKKTQERTHCEGTVQEVQTYEHCEKRKQEIEKEEHCVDELKQIKQKRKNRRQIESKINSQKIDFFDFRLWETNINVLEQIQESKYCDEDIKQRSKENEGVMGRIEDIKNVEIDMEEIKEWTLMNGTLEKPIEDEKIIQNARLWESTNVVLKQIQESKYCDEEIKQRSKENEGIMRRVEDFKNVEIDMEEIKEWTLMNETLEKPIEDEKIIQNAPLWESTNEVLKQIQESSKQCDEEIKQRLREHEGVMRQFEDIKNVEIDMEEIKKVTLMNETLEKAKDDEKIIQSPLKRKRKKVLKRVVQNSKSSQDEKVGDSCKLTPADVKIENPIQETMVDVQESIGQKKKMEILNQIQSFGSELNISNMNEVQVELENISHDWKIMFLKSKNRNRKFDSQSVLKKTGGLSSKESLVISSSTDSNGILLKSNCESVSNETAALTSENSFVIPSTNSNRTSLQSNNKWNKTGLTEAKSSILSSTNDSKKSLKSDSGSVSNETQLTKDSFVISSTNSNRTSLKFNRKSNKTGLIEEKSLVISSTNSNRSSLKSDMKSNKTGLIEEKSLVISSTNSNRTSLKSDMKSNKTGLIEEKSLVISSTNSNRSSLKSDTKSNETDLIEEKSLVISSTNSHRSSLKTGCKSVSNETGLTTDSSSSSNRKSLKSGCKSVSNETGLTTDSSCNSNRKSLKSGCKSVSNETGLTTDSSSSSNRKSLKSGCKSVSNETGLTTDSSCNSNRKSLKSGCKSVSNETGLTTDSSSSSNRKSLKSGCKSVSNESEFTKEDSLVISSIKSNRKSPSIYLDLKKIHSKRQCFSCVSPPIQTSNEIQKSYNPTHLDVDQISNTGLHKIVRKNHRNNKFKYQIKTRHSENSIPIKKQNVNRKTKKNIKRRHKKDGQKCTSAKDNKRRKNIKDTRKRRNLREFHKGSNIVSSFKSSAESSRKDRSKDFPTQCETRIEESTHDKHPLNLNNTSFNAPKVSMYDIVKTKQRKSLLNSTYFSNDSIFLEKNNHKIYSFFENRNKISTLPLLIDKVISKKKIALLNSIIRNINCKTNENNPTIIKSRDKIDEKLSTDCKLYKKKFPLTNKSSVSSDLCHLMMISKHVKLI